MTRTGLPDPRGRTSDTASHATDAVIRAITHMRANLDEPLHLIDHAQVCSYSPYHFHRIFHHVTGTTPARFLMAERMAEAKRLLAHTRLLVRSVQRAAGYESLGTFTTQFTRAVGLPPGEFRRAMDRASGGMLEASLSGDPTNTLGIPIEAEQLDCGWVTVAAIFADGLPEGRALGIDGQVDRAGRSPMAAGTPFVFAFALPPTADLTALGLQPAGSVLVGRAPVPDSPRAGVAVKLRPARPSDPPIVTAAPLLAALRSAPSKEHKSREAGLTG